MAHAYNIAPEDYNKPSAERVELLKKIEAKLGHQPVPPAFWAACQLADLESLKDLCVIPSQYVENCFHSANALISRWTQSARADALDKTSELTSGTKRSYGGSQKSRSAAARLQCKLRDRELCTLTGLFPAEVAHIYPFCMMKNGGGRPDDTRSDFWTSLKLFWTQEHVETWRKSIFSDASNPDDAVESCENLINLNSYAHTLWNSGCFALKPETASEDGKELDLLFFWQPRHELLPLVDLSMTPKSSEKLEGCRPDQALFRRVDVGFDHLRSGDRIKLRTEDPQRHPLPSWELLDMQWNLQRVVGMCGAADWPESELDSNTDTSSLEETGSMEENEGPSLKRICLERAHLSDTLFHSTDGIIDWMPVPEDSVLKQLPLSGQGAEAIPSHGPSLRVSHV